MRRFRLSTPFRVGPPLFRARRIRPWNPLRGLVQLIVLLVIIGIIVLFALIRRIL